MNIDAIMSDPQAPVQVSTPQSQPASQPPSSTTPDVAMDPVHPQQQQQQQQQQGRPLHFGPGQAGPSFAAWDNRKWREEYEIARTKLSDQMFNIANYPDPLLPREPLKQPKGTAETEQRLKELMAKIEGRKPGA